MISCLHDVPGVESGEKDENTTPKSANSPRLIGAVVCGQESGVRKR